MNSLKTPEYLKSGLVSLNMPKFIWVTEIFPSEESLKNDKLINGVVILDATEPVINNMHPVVFAVYKDGMYELTQDKTEIERIDIGGCFSCHQYEGNLK